MELVSSSLLGNALPAVSVLVCTRNRVDVVKTVESVLACSYPLFEVVIVDQSDDDQTSRALDQFFDQKRFRYVRATPRGVSAARNLALRVAKNEVCCFIDDDCEADANWIDVMAGITLAHPKVAVGYCNVKAAPYDPAQGFIPDYIRHGDHLITNFREKCAGRAIGAGRVVRRSVIESLGGFDEMLGPGSAFFACEDHDLAIRAMLGGYQILETDRTSVLHYGFRPHSSGQEFSRRAWFGIGAAYSKPMKMGRADFSIVPLHDLWSFGIRPICADLLRLKRPRGVTRVLSFLKGFATGLRTPLDASTARFVAPAAQPLAARASLLPAIQGSEDLVVRPALGSERKLEQRPEMALR